ncbi:MAG: GNAT family N-acetyltransferase [Sphingobacteriales bacterium]|nr:MAG: GNAT family N-acetyltransferase [Sphingobacteriales bacterium]
MSDNSDHTTSMRRSATGTELTQAIAVNHRQLFCLNTEALNGTVVYDKGLCYTWAGNEAAYVPFPVADDPNMSDELEGMLEFYRSRRAGNVGCWSLDPVPFPGLEAALLARGFQPGWKPCWMVLDMETKVVTVQLIPGLVISTDNQRHIQMEKELPYADGGSLSDKLLSHYPSRAQRFLAFLDGKLVGQCCLFFSAGTDAIAGMYNVGVIPSMRRKGIGMAIVLTACLFAKEHGHRYVTLNANEMGRPVYENAGFRFLGFGLTWWLSGERYISAPASGHLVALAMLVADGSVSALEAFKKSAGSESLNNKLSNGFTLIDIAVHFRQYQAAQWLVNNGTVITTLSAWELGWQEKAAALLRNDPAEINRLYFDWQGTLLHVAVLRNDAALVQLALDAGVDLAVTDIEHHSTALGWAEYFRRFSIIGLIKSKMASDKQ